MTIIESAAKNRISCKPKFSGLKKTISKEINKKVLHGPTNNAMNRIPHLIHNSTKNEVNNNVASASDFSSSSSVTATKTSANKTASSQEAKSRPCYKPKIAKLKNPISKECSIVSSSRSSAIIKNLSPSFVENSIENEIDGVRSCLFVRSPTKFVSISKTRTLDDGTKLSNIVDDNIN
eukprot:Awhi_evm1s9145